MIYAPKTIALAFGVSASLSILVAAEIYARHTDPRFYMREQFACRAVRPVLGGGFRANCSSRWIKRTPEGIVFDCWFRSDANGHRITPQRQDLSDCRKNLAVFLGCSFTVGDGVNQDETLPARFAALRSDLRVLNLGCSGCGPEQALVEAERLQTRPELAVYTLLPTHSIRASGAWQVLGSFGAWFPSYELDAFGIPVNRGPFASVHPWRVWLSSLAMHSALLRRLPYIETDADVEMGARLLLRVKQQLGTLTVLAWPGFEWNDRRMLDRLSQLGVEVVEPHTDVRGLVFADRHPTAEAYRRVAEWLADANSRPDFSRDELPRRYHNRSVGR